MHFGLTCNFSDIEMTTVHVLHILRFDVYHSHFMLLISGRYVILFWEIRLVKSRILKLKTKAFVENLIRMVTKIKAQYPDRNKFFLRLWKHTLGCLT